MCFKAFFLSAIPSKSTRYCVYMWQCTCIQVAVKWTCVSECAQNSLKTILKLVVPLSSFISVFRRMNTFCCCSEVFNCAHICAHNHECFENADDGQCSFMYYVLADFEDLFDTVLSFCFIYCRSTEFWVVNN